MKKLSILFASFCIILCGCGKDVDSISISESESGFTLDCTSFSDTYSTEITVSESAEVTVSVSAKVIGGGLTLEAVDQVGETTNRVGEMTDSGSYTIRLLGPNTYTLTLSGNKFTGTCSISLETIGAVASTEAPPEVNVINPSETGEQSTAEPAAQSTADVSTFKAIEPAVSVNAYDAGSASWSGVYLREDGAVSVTLYKVDEGSDMIEFDIITDTTAINEYAFLSSSNPCTYTFESEEGVGISLTFTGTGISLGQIGISDMFTSAVTGNYVKK